MWLLENLKLHVWLILYFYRTSLVQTYWTAVSMGVVNVYQALPVTLMRRTTGGAQTFGLFCSVLYRQCLDQYLASSSL